MNPPRASRTTYEQFVQRVRRHRPTELLPAIAIAALEIAEGDFIERGERLVLPWSLAAAAKESILRGNEHRDSGVTPLDIRQICSIYNELEDPLSPGSDEFVAQPQSLLTRMSTEQFSYQMSQYEEVGRLLALFEGGSLPPDAEVLCPELFVEVLGCSLEEYAGAGFLFFVGAQQNAGYFDPAWFSQPHFAPIVEVIPAATLQGVLDAHFGASFDKMRSLAGELDLGSAGQLRRYEFNPLTAFPFVEMPDSRFLAPQPQLALQKVTPQGIYYEMLDGLGDRSRQDQFTRDVGLCFERYVGDQLRLLPGDPEVIAELRYNRGQLSVDWFVVFDDLVILVEVKATRLSLPSRMGMSAIASDLDRAIGKAFSQIQRSYNCISAREPAFERIPSDRRVVALIVTLEPYWMANTPLFRSLIGATEPSTPVSILSARALEHWVAASITTNAPVELLLDVLDDEERRTWDFGIAMTSPAAMDKNPIIEAAWNRIPWGPD